MWVDTPFSDTPHIRQDVLNAARFGQAVPAQLGSSISCGLPEVLKATEALLEQLRSADPQDLEADLLLLGSQSNMVQCHIWIRSRTPHGLGVGPLDTLWSLDMTIERGP